MFVFNGKPSIKRTMVYSPPPLKKRCSFLLLNWTFISYEWYSLNVFPNGRSRKLFLNRSVPFRSNFNIPRRHLFYKMKEIQSISSSKRIQYYQYVVIIYKLFRFFIPKLAPRPWVKSWNRPPQPEKIYKRSLKCIDTNLKIRNNTGWY